MNALLQTAYRQLGEAEAIRIHGALTARHPARASLAALATLREAVGRYANLVRNRERISFLEWADRIEAAPLATLDEGRSAIVAALRAMHQATIPAAAPSRLQRVLGRLLRPMTILRTRA